MQGRKSGESLYFASRVVEELVLLKVAQPEKGQVGHLVDHWAGY